MKNAQTRASFAQLDRLAHKTDDISPLSDSLRRQLEAAQRTGKKMERGRPRKDAEHKSRIVPISMDPALLDEIDRYAKSAGVSRSQLVAEGLRLRMRTERVKKR